MGRVQTKLIGTVSHILGVFAVADKHVNAHSEESKIILNFMKYKFRPNDIVLFKASRGMHLEELIEEFYKDC